MFLPHGEECNVPDVKLIGYLLSETHPVGKAKAKLLRSLGFNENNVEALRNGLIRIACEGPIGETTVSEHGTKYVVSGVLHTPDGHVIELRTVWIVGADDFRPRFVTAFPA